VTEESDVDMSSNPTDDDCDDEDYVLPTAAPKQDYREPHFKDIGSYGDGAESYVSEEKFIVFERKLYELFEMIPCPECGERFNLIGKNKRNIGTMVKIRCVCKNHHVFYWNSQPVHHNNALGNSLCSAAILFSGNTFAALNKFAYVYNLRMITKSTYNRNQAIYLFPIVNSAWENEQRKMSTELKDKSLNVSGDGRCDSPGHCAKYGTYSIMDNATNKIINFSLQQCGPELKSVNMEKVGMIDTLKHLKDMNLTVSVLATDRHVGIAKVMKTDYQHIVHQFDVWHMAKSISKRLRKKAVKKCNRPIGPWIKAVVNHLWFSAASCEGDPNVLRDIWTSIIHHIQNVHEWSDKTYFHACNHAPITEDESRKKKWLESNSPALEAFASVVMDKKILEDIGKLSRFCHTGNLEVYHSELIRYIPKNKHFSHQGMISRTQLCAMDHNSHVDRPQIVNKSGP
jgi:hypothetical protein